VAALAWWLVPLVATLLALGWVTWISRARGPADTHTTLAEHARFRDAMGGAVESAPPAADDDAAES
jgi:hypothetical protein